MTTDSQSICDAARRVIGRDRFRAAREMLQPLVASGYPEALYLSAMISAPGESDDDFDRRHLDETKRAADGGYPPAIYAWGAHLDTSSDDPEDKRHAAQLFRRAASLGHPHSQWIHGVDLLHGAGGFDKDIETGLAFIRRAAAAGSVSALQTIADLHRTGEFGFEKDAAKSAALTAQADAGEPEGTVRYFIDDDDSASPESEAPT